MNLDKANLLLVKYEEGDLYLVSSSFFSQEHFVPFDQPAFSGPDSEGLIKISLKVVEGPTTNEPLSNEQILQPVVHIINLSTSSTNINIVNNAGQNEIDGEIEVTVLMGRADESGTFIPDLRSLKPSKAKLITSGGESRPVDID